MDAASSLDVAPKIAADRSALRCVIIGAGPAGLTAAYDLAQQGVASIVLEQDEIVGGISRTVEYKGYRFDIGGHRFFTKVSRVHQWWMDIMAEDFILRPRMSRIYYDDKFFDYPLKPMNALLGLGPIEAVRIGTSYVLAQLFPSHPERNLEQWVSNRFGSRLYQIFFKTYTEKVWGMKCTEINADWAAQRIKNLNLLLAVKAALLGNLGKGKQVVTTLIDQFHYPRLGPGMMWERVTSKLRDVGRKVELGTQVVRIRHDGRRVSGVVVRDASGAEREEAGTHFISSMPVRNLLNAMDPPPPAHVLEAANKLRYRDFLTVALILNEEEPFPDNWIYIHSPKVKVGRIQNFRSWSPEMVPTPGTGCIGLEYFVQENDEVWSAKDEDLIALGTKETAALGLIDPSAVIDGVVIRVPKAYPVYDGIYQDALAVVRSWTDEITNLQLVGRNGQHRYNNQDHSMMTAMLAVENILGASHDVWAVNVEEDYHEEVAKAEPAQSTQITHQQRGGDRLVPGRVEVDPLLDVVRAAFAKYDPVALGVALGALSGFGLFFMTAVLVIAGGTDVGKNLKLLGNYFLGFEVSWSGAFLGLAEAGLAGFAFGVLLAKAINMTVGLHERALMRRLEVRAALDAVDERVG
jgi:protoporphyrinogen oxidase